jgi:hypothetical protein
VSRNNFEEMVRAFARGRDRTVGGLMHIDRADLEELVEEAERELEKRLRKEEWTQNDLDRLATAFALLAYNAELERRS